MTRTCSRAREAAVGVHPVGGIVRFWVRLYDDGEWRSLGTPRHMRECHPVVLAANGHPIKGHHLPLNPLQLLWMFERRTPDPPDEFGLPATFALPTEHFDHLDVFGLSDEDGVDLLGGRPRSQ